jgi:CxxC-x17-CxxC domain-containing protein
MQEQFIDRILNCVDCHGEFIFTAGEQLFFSDKQFKNDPKRCKPCKSRRSGLSAVANGTGPVAAGLSRTETRTLCSDCGIETTVPFKPTQGRPVLCRQCFQLKARAVPKVAATTGTAAADAVALAQASTTSEGSISTNAAVLAAASMSAAPAQSSVATSADLASISQLNGADAPIPTSAQRTVQMIAGSPVDALSPDIPTDLIAAEAS